MRALISTVADTSNPMHLQLDGNGSKYGQLARALRQAIVSGNAQAGSKLPSTHALSENLGLSRNTGTARLQRRAADTIVDARILLDEGQTATVEDPHYQLALHCLRAHGAEVVGIRTDSEGLVADEVPKIAKLVRVTPSHRFPSGTTMSLSSRQELLKFADDNSSWIFEDDYDGELSYSTKPIAALRSMDASDRMIYVGSFSKVMFPALRLAYVVCPNALRRDLIRAKALEDLGCPAIEQAAMRSLFESGSFERHLRGSMLELRRRRSASLDGLAQPAAGKIRVVDSQLGMHMVGWLPGFDQSRLGRLMEMV